MGCVPLGGLGFRAFSLGEWGGRALQAGKSRARLATHVVFHIRGPEAPSRQEGPCAEPAWCCALSKGASPACPLHMACGRRGCMK